MSHDHVNNMPIHTTKDSDLFLNSLIMANAPKKFGQSDPSTPGFYTSSQTALLLLDFHSRFVEKSGGPAAQAAFETAVRLKRWALSHGIHVIHGIMDLQRTPFQTCKGASTIASTVAIMREDGGEEPAELRENYGQNEKLFTRTPGHVSALKSPGLLDHLHSNGIKSLVLTGLSTSGCVLRTAISATDAEFVVSVISDACADREIDVHRLIISKILPARAYVFTAAEFQQGFEAKTD